MPRKPNVIEEITFDNRRRKRCMECDKVAYFSEQHALRAAVTVTSNVAHREGRPVTFTHYQGFCGLWHISGGHGTKKGHRGRTSIRVSPPAPLPAYASPEEINELLSRAARLDRASRRLNRAR